jgi:hypothetical protein
MAEIAQEKSVDSAQVVKKCRHELLAEKMAKGELVLTTASALREALEENRNGEICQCDIKEAVSKKKAEEEFLKVKGRLEKLLTLEWFETRYAESRDLSQYVYGDQCGETGPCEKCAANNRVNGSCEIVKDENFWANRVLKCCYNNIPYDIPLTSMVQSYLLAAAASNLQELADQRAKIQSIRRDIEYHRETVVSELK